MWALTEAFALLSSCIGSQIGPVYARKGMGVKLN